MLFARKNVLYAQCAPGGPRRVGGPGWGGSADHRGLLSPVSAKVHFGLTREEPHVKTPNSNANRSHKSASCVRERQPGHISGATVARIEA